MGQNTRALCDVILRERRHPEWGYRSCLGLFRLAKKYGDARVEAASARALFAGARSYRHVLTILQHNLDQQPLPKPEQPATCWGPRTKMFAVATTTTDRSLTLKRKLKGKPC